MSALTPRIRRAVPSGRLMSAAREAGFTLVEVIVAIFVVSLTILALGPLMTGISRGNSYGQNVTLASSRLQEKVEQLKSVPYDSVKTGTETLTAPAMTRSWTLVAERVPNALKEVDVKISWTDHGKPRYVALKTFIASRNPR